MSIMGIMGGRGIQISAADGGYIIEWMERKPRKSSEPGYLEAERQSMGGGGLGGCGVHGLGFMPPVYKRAVRVDLADALKYAGEILKQIDASGAEDLDGGGDFLQAGG